MIAIFKRELRGYLTSMIGFVFVAVILLLVAFYFYMYNMYVGYPTFSNALTGTTFILMLVIPLLTMRSFAEERHAKTDQLLMTYPVSVPKIVAGKFFSMAFLLLITCVICGICPMIIDRFGDVNYAAEYGALLMYFLMGCCYIAMGMFISSLTESQIIAAVLSYAIFIVLFMAPSIGQAIPNEGYVSLIAFLVIAVVLAVIVYTQTKSWLVTILSFVVLAAAIGIAYWKMPLKFEGLFGKYFSKISFAEGFRRASSYNVISLTSLVTYLSVIFFFCFLTVQSVQKRRWA